MFTWALHVLCIARTHVHIIIHSNIMRMCLLNIYVIKTDRDNALQEVIFALLFK